MSDNLKYWDVLSKTAPSHTKKFKRAGGFTGTAIRPIYQVQKMTETFGPAGIGWGMGEPTFQIVLGVNQEIMVYCTVSLWWAEELGNSPLNQQQASVMGFVPSKSYGPPHTVYGVGGDKVVSHIKANEQYNRPERWENDDEAFKKAFTDAVGNAMKHLGMSADVHMGLFDDSKYVQEREREERAVAAPTVAVPTRGENLSPDALDAALGPSMGSGTLKSSAQAKRDGDWEALKTEIDACVTLEELNLLVASPLFLKEVAPLPNAWKTQMRDYIQTCRDEFANASKAAKPNFDNLQR